MRILYLCQDHGVPVMGQKGSSTHVREFARALQKEGHDVHVLCSLCAPASAAQNPDAFIPPFPLTELRPSRSKLLGYDLRNYLHNWPFYYAAKRIISELRIEAIYERFSLYGLAGDWLGRRLLLPRVVEGNAFLSREHRTKLHFPQWAERCENQVLRGAPALTAVAEPLREEMLARGARPNAVHILPTAVDTDLFHPDSERRNAVRDRLHLQNKFVIGYVGGLAGWHGISSLLDMAAILKEHRTDFVFLIVGGEERHVREQETNARARGLETHFIFTGSLPYPEVPAHINAMDAAIVPDTLPWTCPTKLFEYQASGVPSAAPDYPGVTQALTDGVEGLLFPKKNVPEAAQRLLTLMENPERCAEIATRARARVCAEHAWSCNVKTVLGFFEAQRANRP
ncbi:TPA: hypothetical protein DDW35_07690 [Candidatus Sumerlaeota bacterium]|nr:hypothetical protein [Candidatus Sumerlaeota bacterium]